MNMKWLGAIVGGACFVAGVVMYNEMKTGMSTDISRALDRAVNSKYSEEEAVLKAALSDANAEAGAVIRAEQNEMKTLLSANTEYQTAKAVAEADEKQIKALKSALEVAKKGNTTDVAVGSGNSAVAVSIKDTSQIAQIQSDISRLETEKASKQAIVRSLTKDAEVKVHANRTQEQIDILNRSKAAQKDLNTFRIKKETYRNELRDDETFYQAACNKAFKDNVSVTKVIGSATLQSIPFVLILAWIWGDAVESLRCLKEVV